MPGRLNPNPKWPFWISTPPRAPVDTSGGGGGGTTTPLTITVTATVSTATLINQVGKTISQAVTATTTNPARSVGKAITRSVTATSSAPRVVTKAMPTLAVTATAALVRSAGKIISGIGATVTAGGGFPIILGGYGTDPVVVKQVGAIRAQTVTATTTNPQRSIAKTITRSVTVTAARVLSVGKTISTLTVTVTTTIVRSFVRVFTPGVTVTPTIRRSTGKTISQSVTATVSVPRRIGKILAQAVSTALVFTGIRTGGTTYNMTISVVARVSSTSGFPFIMGTIGADPVLLTQFIAAVTPFFPTPTYPSLFRDRRGKGQERRDLWFRQKGGR